jgi:hypothetical protein
MSVGERFNGFGSPYVLSRLGQGIDTMIRGVDLKEASQRAEVIPQIAKAVSSNFVSANQTYVDHLITTFGGSIGTGGWGKLVGISGNAGVSVNKRDVNQFAQNIITQRLMDSTASATTNEEAREALQNEISSMTANNYRYMKSAINEYTQNHVTEGLKDVGNSIKEMHEHLKERGNHDSDKDYGDLF